MATVYKHVYVSFLIAVSFLCFFIIRKYSIYLISCICIPVLFKVVKKLLNSMIPLKGKAILITGCDTGFGYDLVRRLDEYDCIVFATCLHPDKNGATDLNRLTSNRVHVIPLDVGSDKSVNGAKKYVQKHCPKEGLWAIVNNAGLNVMGDMEWLTVPLYHKIVNVNFYGAVRVTRAFLYLVRKAKGRVINVSSVRGVTSFPRRSAYHVTKHDLETFSDSLRLEMTRFGVNVSVVMPGNFGAATACANSVQCQRHRIEKEEMWASGTQEMRHTYGKLYINSLLEGQAVALKSSPKSTRPVIDSFIDALSRRWPKTRYIVGGWWLDRSAILARLYPYLPMFISDHYIRKITGCDDITVAGLSSNQT